MVLPPLVFNGFVLCFLFFFFQAEDGIRDTSVTGVQTCALPISWLSSPSLVGTVVSNVRVAVRLLREPRVPAIFKAVPLLGLAYVISPLDFIPDRSEERRVGKESRSRC